MFYSLQFKLVYLNLEYISRTENIPGNSSSIIIPTISPILSTIPITLNVHMSIVDVRVTAKSGVSTIDMNHVQE